MFKIIVMGAMLTMVQTAVSVPVADAPKKGPDILLELEVAADHCEIDNDMRRFDEKAFTPQSVLERNLKAARACDDEKKAQILPKYREAIARGQCVEPLQKAYARWLEYMDALPGYLVSKFMERSREGQAWKQAGFELRACLDAQPPTLGS